MSNQAVADFWKAMDGDKQLQQEFFSTVPGKIADGTPIVAFAKSHGFDFTEAELKDAAETLAASTGELKDAALEGVAGGAYSLYSYPSGSTSLSVMTSFSLLSRTGGTVAL